MGDFFTAHLAKCSLEFRTAAANDQLIQRPAKDKNSKTTTSKKARG